MFSDSSELSSKKVLWEKPLIEDFNVSEVTQHKFSKGVDNYEADNPTGYGS